jgi:hypothetical protein
MTIRQSTLERQPAELLLKRLRDRDPLCTITTKELIRRGLGGEVFKIRREVVERERELANEDKVVELQFGCRSFAAGT